MLEAKNIYFRYGRSKNPIFEDFSLSLKRGECTALLAPSGFGKTTLALLLSGYLKPDKGSITLDGKPLPDKGICPVQLIYQHPEKAIDPRWRLRRVLAETGAVDVDLIQRLGIEDAWLNRYPRELSGGELQRFCVARALMSGADYIICDEISTMLDVITQAQIWNVMLSEMDRRGFGMLAVTHNRRLAERVASNIVELG